MKVLYLIPARGGSKGIKGKNIKPLNGKPLIYYSLQVAKELADEKDICVSTDDAEIIRKVEKFGIKVPFKRSAELATDTARSFDVIMHAINYYKDLGKKYDCVVFLQPTSPFRTVTHVQEALDLFSPKYDMVVSVREARTNPYYQVYTEDKNGFMKKVVPMVYTRRQDCPVTYEHNGAIYIINTKSLMKVSALTDFKKVIKYLMDEISSVEIDSPFDWIFAEFLIKEKMAKV